ncbi:MAG: hypothetical protein GY803_14640 [Chloroflexi bacterium]|nr:hypothetical protein [Chloroflexota bacterium]
MTGITDGDGRWLWVSAAFPARSTGDSAGGSVWEDNDRMTRASLTNPVSKNVASRHDATVLRGGEKTPLKGSSKRRPTPANMPPGPAAKAVTWSQRRSVRLKGESAMAIAVPHQSKTQSGFSPTPAFLNR